MTVTVPPHFAPGLADIESMAEQAFSSLPPQIQEAVEGLAFRVEDFPDDETIDAFGLESPFDLLGLYRGVALDRKSSLDVPEDVDIILLYRRPILDYWCEAEDSLFSVVRHVLIHEIGHHLGLSDEDMDAIESAEEEEHPSGTSAGRG
jgi:predicted Zn-dependent protease with MMP-like domain